MKEYSAVRSVISRKEKQPGSDITFFTIFIVADKSSAGVQKIRQILSQTNPNLRKMNPEKVIEDSLMLRLHASGY
jgi:hypothetical protein